MAPNSYDGETCVGECTTCGHFFEVPVRGFYGVRERSGHCPNCNAKRDFKRWDGPVTPRRAKHD